MYFYPYWGQILYNYLKILGIERSNSFPDKFGKGTAVLSVKKRKHPDASPFSDDRVF